MRERRERVRRREKERERGRGKVREREGGGERGDRSTEVQMDEIASPIDGTFLRFLDSI